MLWTFHKCAVHIQDPVNVNGMHRSVGDVADCFNKAHSQKRKEVSGVPRISSRFDDSLGTQPSPIEVLMAVIYHSKTSTASKCTGEVNRKPAQRQESSPSESHSPSHELWQMSHEQLSAQI